MFMYPSDFIRCPKRVINMINVTNSELISMVLSGGDIHVDKNEILHVDDVHEI